jgi:isoamylase
VRVRRPGPHVGDNAATAMKRIVVDTSAYDWEGDAPLQNTSARTIVCERHVRGFTGHPNSGLADKTRGTFANSLGRGAVHGGRARGRVPFMS